MENALSERSESKGSQTSKDQLPIPNLQLPIAWLLFGSWKLDVGSYQELVLRIRSSSSTSATGSATPAPAPGWLLTWNRIRDELRSGSRRSTDSNDDILPALMQVGHRHARLRTGRWCLPDLRARRLVVRVEERQSARSFTGEQQRLGDQQAGL